MEKGKEVYWLVLYGILLVLLFALVPVTIVPAGHRGVIFNRVSGVEKRVLPEGVNLQIPILQSVHKFDCRVKKIEYDATAASKDLQDVTTKVTLNYRIMPDKANLLFQNYGTEYEESVVHPVVLESVKSVTAKYTAEELITKRHEVKDSMIKTLVGMLERANLTLYDAYITDFSFSKAYAVAIESKQVAEQEALKARRVLDQVRVEAEQKVAKARAEAESLRLQREVITSQLLELRKIEVLREAIQKWDGSVPSVILGSGSMPLFNLSDYSNDKSKLKGSK